MSCSNIDLTMSPSSTESSTDRGHVYSEVPPFNTDDVSVDVLVNHLIAAKRALSSTLRLVVRANELLIHAREMHEESVILSAQTSFLCQALREQETILRQVKRRVVGTYDAAGREFKNILRSLDAAGDRLNKVMDMLRNTIVDPVCRPPGEGQKSLMDFVDENTVEGLQEAVKASIQELRAAQTSFDRDILRFDNDLRDLRKATTAATPASPDSSSSANKPMPQLLASLAGHTLEMGKNLDALNRNFDMCVKAVRATEGGAALLLRRAAEVAEGGDPVSISGVITEPTERAITEQDTHMAALLEVMDPQDRAELIHIVLNDAQEVDEVVAEMQAELQHMESDFGLLKDQVDQRRTANVSIVAVFHVLDDIRSRVQGYIQAEAEFSQLWGDEREVILAKLDEMDELKAFYEDYSSAYGTLLLEAERRRAVQDKITATLRKAKEAVNRLVEADRKERERFRQETGEYLPTDLWNGMNKPVQKWEVVAANDNDGGDYTGMAGSSKTEE